MRRPAKSGKGAMPVSSTATLTPRPVSFFAHSCVAPVCCANTAAGDCDASAENPADCNEIEMFGTTSMPGSIPSRNTSNGVRVASISPSTPRLLTTVPPTSWIA